MPNYLNPYIGFAGSARQALEFYHSIFGGELSVVTYKEYSMSEGPDQDNLLMHGMLITEKGMRIMAADTGTTLKPGDPSKIAIMIEGDDKEALSSYWQKLSADGSVIQALEAAPWGDIFGQCTDKFGIEWMINITENVA